MVRYRFLSIFVASTIFIMAFGLLSSTKFLDTISSLVYGLIEYMPGKSVIDVSGCSLIEPSFLSTVTPGKLPTCWFEPVSWLKSVVLPQFWFPTSAYVSFSPSGRGLPLPFTWYLPSSPSPGWAVLLIFLGPSCFLERLSINSTSICAASSSLNVSS